MHIKIKTLLFSIVLLLIMAWIGYFSLPSLLFNAGKYDVLLKWFPKDAYAQLAFNQIAMNASENSTDSGDERIFIYPTFSSSGGGDSTYEERARGISELEQLLYKYPEATYTTSGVKFSLAKLYIWNKQWDKADLLISELIATKNAFYSEEELESFRSMLETRKVVAGKQAAVSGKVMIGNKPAADVFVVLHPKDENGWSSPPYSSYPIAITDEQGLYRFYDIDANEYEVGVGVTPAEVSGYYLTQSTKQTIHINSGKTEQYNFDFVQQVEVVAPVNKERIAGEKLRFEWLPYPGADYYELSITTIHRNKKGKTLGSSTAPLTDEHYKGTSAEYTLEELRGYNRGGSKSTNAEGDVVLSNTGILGAVFPGGEFIWSVDAYDANGFIISSSSGYYTMSTNTAPLFTVSDEGMLEGDKLVINGEYEQAIESYKLEGNNDYALRALARLAYNGITKEDGDPAEALVYLNRISIQTDSDKELLKEVKEKLKRK